MKELLEDIVWNIKAFIAQPIIPTKSYEWVLENDCSYSGNRTGKYVYYWYGDFKTGYLVKVRNKKGE